MEDLYCWQDKFKVCNYSKRLLDKLEISNQTSKIQINLLDVKKGIYYAKKYHGDQKRQTGEPYYSHPIEVAYLLAEHTVQQAPKYYRTDLLVTSLLHDTIEDTALTQDMIAILFGKSMAGQVEGLTRYKGDQKITSAQLIDLLWQDKRYDLLLLKLLDRIHNLQTLKIKSPEKIKSILEETYRSFSSLSLYLEIPTLEFLFTDLCYSLSDLKIKDISSDLFKDNFLLPSLKSQSKIFPGHSL